MATNSSTNSTPSSSSPSPSPSPSPSLVDTLFQRTLDDLIKFLRSSPDPSAAIARALAEIRREIRSPDLSTKSIALQKLSYLSSLHHLDMSWAAFHALELLPSPLLLHPRLAYLAASLSFHPSTTDLIPLSTHQIHKHLSCAPPNPPLASAALHFLALSGSADLARHISPDLLPLLSSSSSPQLRPKAAAAAFRLLSIYPEAVAVLFKPLVDCLSSSDPRTVSAAVGAFCELAVSSPDPAPYLPLAPEFFRLLVDSRNNWVLIKVLKIFACLAPLEPRLAARIVDPVCDLMRRTSAKSLVFECVRTVLSCLAHHEPAVRLAVDKVKEFLSSDDDPNLRYLGLQALSMLGPAHLWAVEANKEVVIRSLTDPDPNIRSEALRLLMGMVSEDNAIEISTLLVNYAVKSDPEFANEILESVLSTCSRNLYELIVDFDWYVSLLGNMARNPHCAQGEEIERQLVDIGLRVRDARPELVRVARDLLIDPALLGNPFLFRVLSAAAWVSGEYVEFTRNPLELLEALLQPRTTLLPTVVRAVYIQAVFKVLVLCFGSFIDLLEANEDSSIRNLVNANNKDSDITDADCITDTGIESEDGGMAAKVTTSLNSVHKENFTHESILQMLGLIEMALGPLSECDEVEVQERARNVLGLVHIIRDTGICNTGMGHVLTEEGSFNEIMKLMQIAFSEELGPVSINSQKKISVPDGLILSGDLSDVAAILGDDDRAQCTISFSLRNQYSHETREDSSSNPTSTYMLAQHRKRHGLYYLATEKDEIESNDYPRANEPLLSASQGDATDHLVKLTEQSLIPSKTKTTKPRPVVVRLDDGDGLSTAGPVTNKDSKDDRLAGAIRDVLLGNEVKGSSSHKKSSDKAALRSLKDDEFISQPSQNITLDYKGESSSRRSRHHSHHKERNASSGNNGDKEEKVHRKSSKSNHHHGKQKHRQRGDASKTVIPQAPVIQDFLL